MGILVKMVVRHFEHQGSQRWLSVIVDANALGQGLIGVFKEVCGWKGVSKDNLG